MSFLRPRSADAIARDDDVLYGRVPLTPAELRDEELEAEDLAARHDDSRIYPETQESHMPSVFTTDGKRVTAKDRAHPSMKQAASDAADRNKRAEEMGLAGRYEARESD